MIDFEAGLTKESKRELNGVMSRLESLDLRAIHESLGEEMINIIRERFDTSIDAKGQRFAPIKGYIYRKSGAGKRGMIRKPGDSPLKVLTLFRSFTFQATADSVTVGTPVEHAKYHTDFPQNNGGIRRVIPLREFMGIETDRDFGRLRKTLLDSLIEMVEGK